MTLATENIVVSRQGILALENVSTSIEQGRITAICGPNGAGKSTLLMALAGLILPVAGRVTISQAPLTSLKPKERAQIIGYLPQDPEIAWDVAVENLVRLGRMPYGDRGDNAVEAAILALGLDELRARPASRLSGGEKARALLARVFAGEPQWILADEPLAALDLAHQRTLLGYFRSAASMGTGVAIVVHDLSTAMNFADHVIVLREGQLLAEGTPQEALTPEIIAEGWKVQSRWIGEPGAWALIAD